MTSKLVKDDRIAVAYALHDSEHQYDWVIDRNDNVSAGYGELKQDGEYEYPLFLEDHEDLPFFVVTSWDIVKNRLKEKGWPEFLTDKNIK